MWVKFVLIGLLYYWYNIIIDLYISDMICDVQSPFETLDLTYRLNVQNNDVINYYNINPNNNYNANQKSDIINYYNTKQNNESLFKLKGDIEEGLYDVCNYEIQIKQPTRNIYQNNYLVFELISKMSNKIIKNMKQIFCKQINYFYPTSIEKKLDFCL